MKYVRLLSRGSHHGRRFYGDFGRTDPDHRGAFQLPYEPGSESEDGLTLPEYIYFTYNLLLQDGWRMCDIDGMDMIGYLKIRAWNAIRAQKKKAPRQRYIDEVWPSLKPG